MDESNDDIEKGLFNVDAGNVNSYNMNSVVAEVTKVFEDYERALLFNDLDDLDRLFWESDHVVRFGIAENLYGHMAISQYRRSLPGGPGPRKLVNTKIVTFGKEVAVISTEFVDEDNIAGRQSQTWIKFAEGWRVVGAHVSLLATS